MIIPVSVFYDNGASAQTHRATADAGAADATASSLLLLSLLLDLLLVRFDEFFFHDGLVMANVELRARARTRTAKVRVLRDGVVVMVSVTSELPCPFSLFA